MEESIRNFAEQFNFEPKVENGDNLRPADSFVVGGMGGSRLSARILQSIFPGLDLIIHKNYGLPEKKSGKALFIASSFSGNTEETIDFLEKAIEQNLNTAVIAKGGKLLQIAQEQKLSFIKLPDVNIQPRMALGYSLLALAKLVKKDFVPNLQEISRIISPLNLEDEGEELAEKIKGRIPVIYASERNASIAEIWKIKFNETAKIPAFFNVFPELNHNEMTGFDSNVNNKSLSEKFFFLFLVDKEDHPRIQKRIKITTQLLKDRGLPSNEILWNGNNRTEQIFNSLILADWTALYTARLYGSEPEQVPMVEEFKRQMNNNK